MSVGDYSTVQVNGLKELGIALRSLPERLANNVGRGATSAAAADIRNEARLKAPVYTGPVSEGHPPPGTLKRSIIIARVPERSNQLKQTYIVHVRSGKKFRGQGRHGTLSQDAFYWIFVEFGTVKMSARPFLRPAFEVRKIAAIDTFKTYLAKRLPVELQKLNLPGIKATT